MYQSEASENPVKQHNLGWGRYMGPGNLQNIQILQVQGNFKSAACALPTPLQNNYPITEIYSITDKRERGWLIINYSFEGNHAYFKYSREPNTDTIICPRHLSPRAKLGCRRDVALMDNNKIAAYIAKDVLEFKEAFRAPHVPTHASYLPA